MSIHASQLPKLHLDRFSRFLQGHLYVWQTDRQTMLRVTSVAVGCICAMWPSNRSHVINDYYHHHYFATFFIIII